VSTTPEPVEPALAVREVEGGVRFELAVKPRSSRAAVLGLREGALVIAVRAAPVEGAANEEVRELLAKVFVVPRRDVVFVGGEKSKKKLVELRGPSALDVVRIAREATSS
jgi:uncharacterized protein (TIGR00251 family)